MSNAPKGAMSSPWGNPETLKELISNTDYFKDTKVNNQSPTVKETTKCTSIEVPVTKIIPDTLKQSLNKFFINNNINIVTITDNIIVISYEGNKLEIRLA